MSAREPVWLISGCSSGLGRALAAEVLRRGWCAAVTARKPADIADIVAGHGGRALALPLDVTRPDQVRDATARALDHFGSIDVLVNNAGHGLKGAVEEVLEADYREVFETNFFGLVALTRSILPGMRARGSGCVVNVTSAAGFIGNAGSGYYAATKFAVEGLSDALAKELRPLGIKVLVVAPGPFRTDFAGRSLVASGAAIADYAASAGDARAQLLARDGRQPGDPARAARAVVEAVTSPRTPGHLLLGRSAITRVRAKLEEVGRDIDAWEAVGLAADFPADEAPGS